jgi:hypothetical protein
MFIVDGLQLVRLLRVLLYAEARKAGVPLRNVDVPLQITIADGGQDAIVQWQDGEASTDYFRGRDIVFQCKATDHGDAQWKKEVWTKKSQRKKAKVLNEAVAEVLERGGSYVGVTATPLVGSKADDRAVAIKEGIRAAGGERPDMALIALTHTLTAQPFYSYAEAGCLEVRPTVTPLGSHADGIEDTPLAARANEAREAWAERMPRDVADLWGFIANLDDEKRLALLAHCASRTVNALRLPWDSSRAMVGLREIVEDALGDFERVAELARFPCAAALIEVQISDPPHRHPMRRIDPIGVGACGGVTHDGSLIDGYVFARHRSLVDGCCALDQEPVRRDPLIGFPDDGLPDFQVFDRNLARGAVRSTDRGASGRQLGERFNRALRAAPRIVFERVAQTEQEQKQRAFGERAERGGASGSDQHQGIDFELLQAKVVDRLAQREKAAEAVCADVECRRQPFRGVCDQLFDAEADRQKGAAGQREDQLGIRTENAAMRMVVAVAGGVLRLGLVAGMIMSIMVPGLLRCRLGDRAKLRQLGANIVAGDLLAIIFDPHHARDRGVRLDHTGQGAEAFSDRACAACTTNVGHLPKNMAIAVADRGASGADDLSDACDDRRNS